MLECLCGFFSKPPSLGLEMCVRSIPSEQGTNLGTETPDTYPWSDHPQEISAHFGKGRPQPPGAKHGDSPRFFKSWDDS